MKLSSLFDIITDAQDVLDLFDGVTNVDQLRGRLRRLSQIEADDLLACLTGLQTSVAKALSDTLEVSPDLEDHEDELSDLLDKSQVPSPDSDPADLSEVEHLPGETVPRSEDPIPTPPEPSEK